MATVAPVPASTTESTAVVPAKSIHGAPASKASVVVHVVPAKEQVRMGRAATEADGINWTTMTAMIFFHVGALAALFFFNWQRFAVAAALYVLAINVGIGM